MTLTLSNCELASIYSALADTRDKSCVIERSTATQGSLGYNVNDGYEPIATVTARLTQPSANILALYADQIGDQLTWQVALPDGTDIKPLDHLIIDGQTLTVQVELAPQSFTFETNVLASQIKGQVPNG